MGAGGHKESLDVVQVAWCTAVRAGCSDFGFFGEACLGCWTHFDPLLQILVSHHFRIHFRCRIPVLSTEGVARTLAGRTQMFVAVHHRERRALAVAMREIVAGEEIHAAWTAAQRTEDELVIDFNCRPCT